MRIKVYKSVENDIQNQNIKLLLRRAELYTFVYVPLLYNIDDIKQKIKDIVLFQLNDIDFSDLDEFSYLEHLEKSNIVNDTNVVNKVIDSLNRIITMLTTENDNMKNEKELTQDETNKKRLQKEIEWYNKEISKLTEKKNIWENMKNKDKRGGAIKKKMATGSKVKTMNSKKSNEVKDKNAKNMKAKKSNEVKDKNAKTKGKRT